MWWLRSVYGIVWYSLCLRRLILLAERLKVDGRLRSVPLKPLLMNTAVLQVAVSSVLATNCM